MTFLDLMSKFLEIIAPILYGVAISYLLSPILNFIENKILRDEDSQKIYRLMRSLQTYDLSYNIDPSGKLANYAYYSYFMQKKDANVASYYEKIIKAVEKKYSAMYDLIVSQ